MGSHRSETPFDSIESSHEYVSLLGEAIAETLCEVEEGIAAAGDEGAARRQQALQLVRFNLNKLATHVTASSRILNDLRILRRLLLEERTLEGVVRGASE